MSITEHVLRIANLEYLLVSEKEESFVEIMKEEKDNEEQENSSYAEIVPGWTVKRMYENPKLFHKEGRKLADKTQFVPAGVNVMVYTNIIDNKQAIFLKGPLSVKKFIYYVKTISTKYGYDFTDFQIDTELTTSKMIVLVAE